MTTTPTSARGSTRIARGDTWSLDRRRSGYDVVYERLDVDDPWVPLDVKIVVFEIEGTRFFDAFPGDREIERVSERSALLFLPVHSFGRLRADGGELHVEFVQPSWIDDQRETLETTHTTIDRNVVLTATPPELQRLLARAMNEDGAFSDDGLVLTRDGRGGGG